MTHHSRGCMLLLAQALIDHVCHGNAPADGRAQALQQLLPRWRAELVRRAVDAPADVKSRIDPSVAFLESLLDMCAVRLLRRLATACSSTSDVEGPAEVTVDSAAAERAIRHLVNLIAAAAQPIPPSFSAFARDESHDEFTRLRVLQLLRGPGMAAVALHVSYRRVSNDFVILRLVRRIACAL